MTDTTLEIGRYQPPPGLADKRPAPALYVTTRPEKYKGRHRRTTRTILRDAGLGVFGL